MGKGKSSIEFFTTPSRLLTTLRKTAWESTFEILENAGYQHFLLLSTVFYTLSKREIVILAIFNMSSASALNLVVSKILSFDKRFTAIRG